LLLVIALFLFTLQPAFRFPPVKENLSQAAESIKQVEEISSGVFPIIQLPHPGYLSTKFSPYHPGVDIAAGLGVPVKSISSGIVEEVFFGVLGYGNNIIISHANGVKSLYAHMGRIYVKKDQQISLETTLGTVGLTGFTTGPHTHLEISQDGKNIDPLTVLPKISEFPTE
jgi:murein DD-endopeptidase MepM/ murein hydrolase activator NlpD